MQLGKSASVSFPESGLNQLLLVFLSLLDYVLTELNAPPLLAQATLIFREETLAKKVRNHERWFRGKKTPGEEFYIVSTTV